VVNIPEIESTCKNSSIGSIILEVESLDMESEHIMGERSRTLRPKNQLDKLKDLLEIILRSRVHSLSIDNYVENSFISSGIHEILVDVLEKKSITLSCLRLGNCRRVNYKTVGIVARLLKNCNIDFIELGIKYSDKKEILEALRHNKHVKCLSFSFEGIICRELTTFIAKDNLMILSLSEIAIQQLNEILNLNLKRLRILNIEKIYNTKKTTNIEDSIVDFINRNCIRVFRLNFLLKPYIDFENILMNLKQDIALHYLEIDSDFNTSDEKIVEIFTNLKRIKNLRYVRVKYLFVHHPTYIMQDIEKENELFMKLSLINSGKCLLVFNNFPLLANINCVAREIESIRRDMIKDEICSYFNNSRFSDFKLKVISKDFIREYNLHRIICGRYIKENTVYEEDLEYFDIFLRYLYGMGNSCQIDDENRILRIFEKYAPDLVHMIQDRIELKHYRKLMDIITNNRINFNKNYMIRHMFDTVSELPNFNMDSELEKYGKELINSRYAFKHENADVIIRLVEERNEENIIQTFYCHKVVLSARSEYFKCLFSQYFRECEQKIITIQENNKTGFSYFIDFIYRKNLDLSDIYNAETRMRFCILQEIVYIANKYLCEPLKRIAEIYLVHELRSSEVLRSSLNSENILRMAHSLGLNKIVSLF
jgi:hypothetical protein